MYKKLIVGLIFVGCLMTQPRLVAQSSHPSTSGSQRRWQQAAIQTAHWLDSVRTTHQGHTVWPANPQNPDVVVHHLYSGTAGVVLFYLQLYQSTDRPAHLQTACDGADTLVSIVNRMDKKSNPGLWVGLAGYGYTLYEAFRATGNRRYAEAAEKCVQHLADTAQPIDPDDPGQGVIWTPVTDVIGGGAGIGFFLLYAAHQMNSEQALPLAIRCGDGLLHLAQPVKLEDGTTGQRWSMSPDYPREMPNYSHGTAGICDFLVALHQSLPAPQENVRADGNDRFLKAALQGAHYLESIATRKDDGCLIYHHTPDGQDLFYLGWCHGPAGTGRFFLRLSEATGDVHWKQLTIQGGRSLLVSGIPAKRTPGFWNNVGICCGSAGVGSYAVDLHQLTQQDEYLALAKELTQDLMRRATRVELKEGRVGLKWNQAEHRVRPKELAAQTGLMQGAAGIGLWLLKLDAVENKRPYELHLPIRPW